MFEPEDLGAKKILEGVYCKASRISGVVTLEKGGHRKYLLYGMYEQSPASDRDVVAPTSYRHTHLMK